MGRVRRPWPRRGCLYGGVVAGDKFEALTAIQPHRRTNQRGHSRWVWDCRCECGAIVTIPVGNLQTGNSKSCGCKKAERVAKARTTHGHGKRGSTSREYHSWTSMRARCLNPDCPKFPIYGGRGISICSRWDSFENFLADMGPRPAGTTLDRKETDGNYEPCNCRWATPLEQARNRRPVRLNEDRVRSIRADVRSAEDLAQEYGVTPGHIADVRSGRAWPHVR